MSSLPDAGYMIQSAIFEYSNVTQSLPPIDLFSYFQRPFYITSITIRGIADTTNIADYSLVFSPDGTTFTSGTFIRLHLPAGSPQPSSTKDLFLSFPNDGYILELNNDSRYLNLNLTALTDLTELSILITGNYYTTSLQLPEILHISNSFTINTSQTVDLYTNNTNNTYSIDHIVASLSASPTPVGFTFGIVSPGNTFFVPIHQTTWKDYQPWWNIPLLGSNTLILKPQQTLIVSSSSTNPPVQLDVNIYLEKVVNN